MPLPPPKPTKAQQKHAALPKVHKLKGEDLYAANLHRMKKEKREKLTFPNINKGKKDRVTCFYWAAMRGDLKEIRKWAKKSEPPDINWVNTNGMTAAHIAAWQRHHNVVKWLRKHGADFTIRDQKGRTPDDIVEKCQGSHDLRRRIKEKRKKDAKEAKEKEEQRIIEETKKERMRIAAEKAAKHRTEDGAPRYVR